MIYQDGAVRAVMLISLVTQIRDIADSARERSAVEAIIKDAGVTAADLESPNEFVSLKKLFDLLERCSVYFDNPWFGLQIASGFQVGGTGLIGLVMYNAPTVREAIQQIAACGPTFIRPVHYGFSEDRRNGSGCLTWNFREACLGLESDFLFSQFVSAGIILRLRSRIGSNWQPLRVSYTGSMVAVPPEVRAILGPVISFDASENALCLSRSTLDQPMSGADQPLYTVLCTLARKWLEEARVEPCIVARARNEIMIRLKEGSADLEHVSRDIGVPQRQLQSLLEASGTSFEKVLNETRAEIALRLLGDSDLSVSDIAYELGYSEPSVLARATKRWFKKSPSEIRNERREQAALRVR